MLAALAIFVWLVIGALHWSCRQREWARVAPRPAHLCTSFTVGELIVCTLFGPISLRLVSPTEWALRNGHGILPEVIHYDD